MTTAFDSAIEASRIAGTRELTGRLIDERRVARRLVKSIFARGYAVTVYDGEEYVTFAKHEEGKPGLTRDLGEVMRGIFSTDEDIVYAIQPMADGSYRRVGWFHLIYGNSGEELIANYVDNPECNDIYNSVAR